MASVTELLSVFDATQQFPRIYIFFLRGLYFGWKLVFVLFCYVSS